MEKAVRICDARFGNLKLCEGDNSCRIAVRGHYRRNLTREKLENAMRKLVIGALTTIAIAIFHPVVVASILPKDTAARIEAIPVQTLTISDQQFLTGDRSGRPTTIAGALRIARGSGRYFQW